MSILLYIFVFFFFFFKQKTAYEMRISDWSSDVCSSDLHLGPMRSTNGLDRALATIANDPVLSASWAGQLARTLLTAARQRPHSIGAHYREDAVDDAPPEIGGAHV